MGILLDSRDVRWSESHDIITAMVRNLEVASIQRGPEGFVWYAWDGAGWETATSDDEKTARDSIQVLFRKWD